MTLSTNSPYTFVWFDNAGQTMPTNSRDLSVTIDANGFTVNIHDQAKINEPIILINNAAKNNVGRHTINVGANANVQIIEYLSSDDQNANNATQTIINCSKHSMLQHCILQHASDDASINQHATTTINQDLESEVQTNVFTFGGGDNKVTLNIALRGAQASCKAANLAYMHGKEKQDVLFNIQHQHPNCNSSSLARAVVKDQSITDFIGRITVDHGAKKTIADLQIKNLLCSPKAQANNRPELEIYDDDVKCSHGSSTGQLDKNALFYMRSRGIDLPQATEMLIAGFIQPVINNCRIPSVVDFVQNLIAKR